MTSCTTLRWVHFLHHARPVHLIITMIKWIRTSRLSIKNSLSLPPFRFRAKKMQLEMFEGLAPESQGLNCLICATLRSKQRACDERPLYLFDTLISQLMRGAPTATRVHQLSWSTRPHCCTHSCKRVLLCLPGWTRVERAII